MKHFTLFTCLLAFLFISCGNDDEPEPIALDDPEHIESHEPNPLSLMRLIKQSGRQSL